MSDVKRVLLERLLNHRFTGTGDTTRIDPSDTTLTPIWGDGKSSEHQDWIFGDRNSLKSISLDDRIALTKDYYGHSGVPDGDVDRSVIDAIHAFIDAMERFNALFPTHPPELPGRPIDQRYAHYDLYALVRDKLLWNFEHGAGHPHAAETGDEKIPILNQHTGY